MSSSANGYDSNRLAELLIRLKAAGVGFAVANAMDTAKSAADRITVSNNDHAIAVIFDSLDLRQFYSSKTHKQNRRGYGVFHSVSLVFLGCRFCGCVFSWTGRSIYNVSSRSIRRNSVGVIP